MLHPKQLASAATELPSVLQRCIDTSTQCATLAMQVLNQIVGRCLDEPESQAWAQLHLLRDCSDVCQATAHFLARGAKLHPDCCRLSAELCERCAVHCEQIAEEVTRRCALACWEAAAAFRALAYA